jgi:hypothetical protein
MSKAPVTIPENPDTPLTESQASILYNRSKAWFQRKRWDGTGAPYLKMDGAKGGVLYRRQDLDNYFNRRLCRSTSDSTVRSA